MDKFKNQKSLNKNSKNHKILKMNKIKTFKPLF